MYKNRTESAVKGAAMGLLAGGALGAAGAYVAQQHPREVKKAMKKAEHTAEKAMQKLDHMMNF